MNYYFCGFVVFSSLKISKHCGETITYCKSISAYIVILLHVLLVFCLIIGIIVVFSTYHVLRICYYLLYVGRLPASLRLNKLTLRIAMN